MKQKHVQELKAQLTAHRATVQMMKEKTENDKLASLSTMQEKHREFTGALKICFFFVSKSTRWWI